MHLNRPIELKAIYSECYCATYIKTVLNSKLLYKTVGYKILPSPQTSTLRQKALLTFDLIFKYFTLNISTTVEIDAW